MFQVKDKNGTDVNLKDVVRFPLVEEDLFGGSTKEVIGIVISLNSETTVQVQPEEGASVEVLATHVTVTESLINDVKSMATTEDMLAVIERAEARFRDEVANGTNKKKSGGSKKAPAKKAIQATINLEL